MSYLNILMDCVRVIKEYIICNNRKIESVCNFRFFCFIENEKIAKTLDVGIKDLYESKCKKVFTNMNIFRKVVVYKLRKDCEKISFYLVSD